MQNPKIIQFILSLLIFSFSINSFAQLKTDSLENELNKATKDTVKIKLMLDLCWDLKSVDAEKALTYANDALELAKRIKNYRFQAIALKNMGVINIFTGDYNKAKAYHLEALQISKSINYEKGISGCYNNLGMICGMEGNFIEAVSYYKSSLEIDKRTNNKSGIASSLTNLGNIFQKQGDYEKAIEYYIEVLKIQEELGNKSGIADIYNNIGALNEKQREFDSALKNYQKALILYVEIQNKRKSANALNNIGAVLSKHQQYTKALEYYYQALEIRKEYGAQKGIASTMINIGQLHQELKNYKKAYAYYRESLAIYLKIQSKPGLANAYQAIGSYYKDIRNYPKSIENLNTALSIAKELQLRQNLQEVYREISLVYAQWIKYPKAYEYRLLYEKMKDSLTTEDNSRNIIELQLQFEFEKEQKEKELKGELEKLRTQKELNKQKIINYSLFGGLLSFIIIAFLIYRAYTIKSEDNLLLAEQKKQISQKNEELRLYQEEIISQKEHLQTQNELKEEQLNAIELRNRKISDSIQYASRIQKALLPPEEKLATIFSDYFLLNKAKDIVSGDFYWLKTFGDKIFLAVADSTGHGVPGAFMSILGISFLNELVKNQNNNNAAQILDGLRELLKTSLNKADNKSKTGDGIDIAFCIIDKKEKEIQFSGAYNPIIIIKTDKDSGEHKLIELKGDKMPIGTHLKEETPFTNHTIKFEHTDKLYLFTDGYLDQFGGLDGRKFLLNKFKQVLLEICILPMTEQKLKLLNIYANWKEERDQIDDILILGFSL
jgi:serine phosphatase RsbU (regulator of sigma subunit)/Tfp pilus assembly protein PilF